MNTNPTHIAICAEYATRQPGPPIGPCVLRPLHQGRIHQDVHGVQWSTPAEPPDTIPATGGIVRTPHTIGEDGTGCTLPTRAPDGPRTRTRTDTPTVWDTRTPDRADTHPTRADLVRNAIGRAFDIPAGHTPEHSRQDTVRSVPDSVWADTGQPLDRAMQRALVDRQDRLIEKALSLLAEAYAEQERLRVRVRDLSEELGQHRGTTRITVAATGRGEG